jgi:hypothetical protein
MRAGEGGPAPRDLTPDTAAILRGDPLTPSELARYNSDPEAFAANERERDRQQANRVWKALMLALTLDDCRALLHGRHVPPERLDQKWLRRFGAKKAAA